MFTFKLEQEDGTTIPLSADRMLRVVETRSVDDDPMLVVEHV
jgi:hypothetical protein